MIPRVKTEPKKQATPASTPLGTTRSFSEKQCTDTRQNQVLENKKINRYVHLKLFNKYLREK
jgi:hypothetical protein